MIIDSIPDNNNRVLKEVAYGKISTQSTQLADFHPGQANDGNVDTFSHTAMNAETSFWEVDLGRNFMIRQIQIFVRKCCCGELYFLNLIYIVVKYHTSIQLNIF